VVKIDVGWGDTVGKVPIYKLYKEREGAAQKGEDYKQSVIEYMESLNYMLQRDSAFHSSLDDLQFDDKATGDRVVAEAKSHSDGVSPNDFKSELSRYFLEYIETREDRRFDFYIFAENLSNEGLWKALFDRDVENNDQLKSFYEKLLENAAEGIKEELHRTTVDEFRDFAVDTHVHVATYLNLQQQAQQLEESERFQYEPYLHPYEAIEEEVEYSTNLYEISSLPEWLYIIDTTSDAESANVYNYNNEAYPVQLYDRKLYSLIEPNQLPSTTRHYIKEEQYERVNFDDWIQQNTGESEDTENIIRALLRGIFTLLARERDCVVDREKGTVVYPELSSKHGSERKHGRIWLVKQLDAYDEFRHRAVKVRVRNFGDEYYYVLLPTQVFTSDGKRRVSGDRKYMLQNSFSPNRFQGQNSKWDRQLSMWQRLLSGDQQRLDKFMSRSFTAVEELSFSRVKSSLGMKPPADGEERNELLESSDDLRTKGDGE
jgi:hypothetical protein